MGAVVSRNGPGDVLVSGGGVVAPQLLAGGASGPTRFPAFVPRQYRPLGVDWNADGRADAYLSGAVYFGDATTGIAASASVSCSFPRTFSGTLSAWVGDIDRDGKPDLAGVTSWGFSDRQSGTRPEMVRVILTGRRTTGPAPVPLPGAAATQILR